MASPWMMWCREVRGWARASMWHYCSRGENTNLKVVAKPCGKLHKIKSSGTGRISKVLACRPPFHSYSTVLCAATLVYERAEPYRLAASEV
jgi:hypothetical protein